MRAISQTELKEAEYRVECEDGQDEIVTDAIGPAQRHLLLARLQKLFVSDGRARDIQCFDVAAINCPTRSGSPTLRMDGCPADGWDPRRRRRQHLGRGERRSRLYGVHVFNPSRATHRHDPSTGDLRQRVFGGRQRNRLFHDGEPVLVLA
jgi:hypothetical protein